MKYSIIVQKTGEITYYDTDHDRFKNCSTDRDKLDSIDIKIIETYLREKDLEIIYND